MRTFRSDLWLAALCLVGSACQYDLDQLYKHESGPSINQVPADLIDLWTDDQLSGECKECARGACVDASQECRDDAECLALTTCVAKAKNPAEQNSCRAQHTAWLREQVAQRDVGGPYHTCVFQNSCAVECGSHEDQTCASTRYGWPKASDETVGLHIQLLEGQASRKVSGARVRACQPENTVECKPLSDWATTDGDSVVDLDVSLSLGVFTGYLEIEGGGLYPSLVQFGWPVGREMTTRVTVVSESDASFLLNNIIPPIKVPADVTKMRGFIQARAFSCVGVPATDVGFELEGADMYTQDWYTPGAVIYPDFTAAGTSELGAGGITSVVPGLRTLLATHAGETIAKILTPVRKDYMTIVFISPTGI
jgi:hypothetical protein